MLLNSRAPKKESPQKPGHFSTTLDMSLADKLRHGLEEQGFDLTQPQYTVFSGKKKGVSCTLYQSGKLLVQGKDMQEFIEFYLEPEILQDFSFTYRDDEQVVELDKTPRIGIDEAGKGDFFGPLCIAGVFAGGEDVAKLKALGVRDSKGLRDEVILKIAREVRKNFPHSIVRIGPEKYNELYVKFANLNKLLAWGHSTAIESLMKETQCDNVIIDQFAAEHVVESALKRKGISPNLTQRHRGEEDIVVAAASILARAAFVEGIDKLGKTHSTTLPKGASKKVIQVGRALVAQKGSEVLKLVGKVHFKTHDDILS